MVDSITALKRAVKVCAEKYDAMNEEFGNRGWKQNRWTAENIQIHDEILQARHTMNAIIREDEMVNEEYSCTDADDSHLHDMIEKHQSYGCVSVTRPQGSSKTLFGSLIPHDRWVSLTISRAVRYRSLNSDWISEKDDIIEINMSNDQWAKIVARSSGEPTPVTISRYRGESFQAPIQKNRFDLHIDEFKAALDKAKAEIDIGLDDAVEKLTQKGPLKVADRKLLADRITRLQKLLSKHGTLEYMSRQFMEFTDSMRHEFIQDAEAWMERVMEANSLQNLEHDKEGGK
jgi:hypothetical protein